MRPVSLVFAQVGIAAAIALGGCGGTGRAVPAQPASQAANPATEKTAYEAGVVALRRGDYETAMGSFRAAGGYRDAPRRLADVLRAAGAAELAAAETKLRTGHPRAAVVLVQVAMRDYHATGPAATDLLRRAQAAQVAHHRQQLAEQARAAAKQRGKH